MNVVISGANRGIGLAMVKEFKSRGATVYGLCRESSDELEKLGVTIVTGVDVTDDSSMEKLKETLSTHFNKEKIDVLVNNAGLMHQESLDKLDWDNMRQQYEVNSLGPLRLTHSLLGFLDKGSKIGIVSSRMGSMGDNTSGGFYGYRMSKAAVNMAGVCLSHDLADRKIAVGILHPGYVKTRMTNFNGNIGTEESAKGLVDRIEELNMNNTGCFFHSNGEKLPW